MPQIGAELFAEQARGCLSLISSGQDASDSEFIDADRDGSDVFIRTSESLLPQDPGLTDVYDARIGGGFPPARRGRRLRRRSLPVPAAAARRPDPRPCSIHKVPGDPARKSRAQTPVPPKGKRRVVRARQAPLSPAWTQATRTPEPTPTGGQPDR